MALDESEWVDTPSLRLRQARCVRLPGEKAARRELGVN